MGSNEFVVESCFHDCSDDASYPGILPLPEGVSCCQAKWRCPECRALWAVSLRPGQTHGIKVGRESRRWQRDMARKVRDFVVPVPPNKTETQ